MVNIYNKKNNALHYAIAFFSGLTFLASGMAIAFPSAVLSLGLLVPLIIACGAFSFISLILAGQAVSKNEVISEKEAALAEKTEEVKGLNETISEKEVQLNKEAKLVSYAKNLLGKTDAIISSMSEQMAEKDRQMAKKDREIEAKSKYIINSDEGKKRLHEEHKAKNAAYTVKDDDMRLNDMRLDEFFGDASDDLKSKSDAQPADGTKAAPEKIGGEWFGPKTQILVAGAIGLLAHANLLNQ